MTNVSGYKYDFKDLLNSMGLTDHEVVELYRLLVGGLEKSDAFEITDIKGEGGFEGKRIVHGQSGTEIPFTSQVMQDTFLDVLQQTFCDKDQTLQDLEEKVYWKGSKRPLSSTSND